MRRAWAVAVAFLGVFAGISCASPAPPIEPGQLPRFDSAHICDVPVWPGGPVPDSLDIANDCVPLDAADFRALVLSATPASRAMWKGGGLIIARSRVHGDRFFYFSYYGHFFIRPGYNGIYVVAKPDRPKWRSMLEGLVDRRAQVPH